MEKKVTWDVGGTVAGALVSGISAACLYWTMDFCSTAIKVIKAAINSKKQ